MSIISYFPGGGGSATLNVTAYSSESEWPASAEENAIAFISSVAVGLIIASRTAPSTASAGDVWLSLNEGKTLTFSDETQVFMMDIAGVSQYSGTAWEYKTAKVYESGEWVNLYASLYGNGDNIFTTIGKTLRDTYPSITDGQYIFKVNDTATNWSYLSFTRSSSLVDLTNYTTLTIEFGKNTFSGDAHFGLALSKSALSGDGQTWTPMLNVMANSTCDVYAGNPAVNGRVSVDVTNYIGTYYIYLTLCTGVTALPPGGAYYDSMTGSGTVYVKNVIAF